nr:terminase TerL endonuclease subunit [Heyndrickxia oleronia]
MIRQKYVDQYIELYRSGKVKFNKERELLIEYLEEHVLSRDDLYFDDEMIENCIKFGEKWYFPLQPFQKFLIAFVFLFFKSNNRNFYRKFLWMLGRGGGKNGLISVITHFLISELHGIDDYNISVVANSEEQAKTSPDEVKKTVRKHETLKNAFKSTETQTTSKVTGSVLKFRTSNGDTKDGLRDGATVFDEIHQYESNKDVKVHISGLGKRPNPREFYIGTDGYVRDGFLDKLKEKAIKVLKGESRPNAIFPFICKLNDEKEADDLDNWELANPMLSKPLSEYAVGLFETIKEEYEDLVDDPSNREEFMTKRMNLPVTDLERSVAKWEEIIRTGFEEDGITPRTIPDLQGASCIGCLDYASMRDFAAVGLLFKKNKNYIFITHSFVRKEFADIHYGYSRPDNEKKKRNFAPIREWEEQGFLTVVDEPTISPDHIVKWFLDKQKEYNIQKIVADNFRLESIRKVLTEAGFELDHVRNSSAIHSLLAPRIENAFANHEIIFGDNPLMRWYTQNVLVITKGNGNKVYEKKEAVKRKIDGFIAFVHGMYRADEIEEEVDFFLDAINF